MGYLWASHLFQAGDPLAEIQLIFNNDNGSSLFLRESGLKFLFFWSSEGVTNEVSMGMDVWCSGRMGKYRLTLDIENGVEGKWVNLRLDCSDKLKVLTQTLTKFSWSFQMSDQWFLRNNCFWMFIFLERSVHFCGHRANPTLCFCVKVLVHWLLKREQRDLCSTGRSMTNTKNTCLVYITSIREGYKAKCGSFCWHIPPNLPSKDTGTETSGGLTRQSMFLCSIKHSQRSFEFNKQEKAETVRDKLCFLSWSDTEGLGLVTLSRVPEESKQSVSGTIWVSAWRREPEKAA